jgi:hypothetical protein
LAAQKPPEGLIEFIIGKFWQVQGVAALGSQVCPFGQRLLSATQEVALSLQGWPVALAAAHLQVPKSQAKFAPQLFNGLQAPPLTLLLQLSPRLPRGWQVQLEAASQK